MIDFVTALFTTAFGLDLSEAWAVLIIVAALSLVSAAVLAFFRAANAGKFDDAEFDSEPLMKKMDKNPEAYGGVAGLPLGVGIAQSSRELHHERFR